MMFRDKKVAHSTYIMKVYEPEWKKTQWIINNYKD